MRFLAATLAFLLAVATSEAQRPPNPAHVSRDGPALDGTEPQTDLPPKLRMRNVGGRDGAGLCVFTSIAHSARYHSVRCLYDFQQWMKSRDGGGWPEKVDRMISERCRELNVTPPKYLNVETNDLDVLASAMRSGRMVGVTYSISPTGRYGGQRIAHMVNLVAARVGRSPTGEPWWAILDNNYPDSVEWMTESQFVRTYTGGRLGWAFVFLAPSPPLPPRP